jgi:glycosyltransferase involved in cell wall biosynthesis
MSTARPLRVLHIAASDQRRGAEVFAADLIGHTAHAVEHRMLFLRANSGATVTYPCPTRQIRAGHGGRRAVPLAARDVRTELGRWRPNVVLAHGGEAFRTAAIAALRTRVPVVYRRIGMAPERMRTGWRRSWHKRLIGRAAKVVCLADVVRDELTTRFGVAPERSLMIPNAVDPARLCGSELERRDARAELGFADDACTILSIGALSWEKNPLGMLDITEPLLRENDKLRHVYAGQGPLREALEAKVSRLGLEERVAVLGGRDDVGRLFAAADLMLFASRELGMEGMPTTLIEAGLVGRPVVAAAVPGVSEVVADRVTGLLAAPGDVEGLRSALKELLADPEMRAALGTAARARCRERFTIQRVAPQYLALWESLAS